LLHELQKINEPVFALDDNPTTENIAKKIFYTARDLGIPVSEVTLWENDSSCVAFNGDVAFHDLETTESAVPIALPGTSCRTPIPTLHGQEAQGLQENANADGGSFMVTREFRFCFGHRLQNYPGKCRQIHGHNGRLFVTVGCEDLDSMGMAADFGEVKRGVDGWIDREWDHAMILRHGDPLIRLLEKWDCPVVVLNENPTTENLAKAVYSRAVEQGLEVRFVQLWETDLCSAGYLPISLGKLQAMTTGI
jgi:6-pyruvoyltetrahydropterin/6-carboxytetrahydropterin synthase